MFKIKSATPIFPRWLILVGRFLLLLQILLVAVQHRFFQLLSCLQGDGMADVPKFAVFVPPAGHSDKQAVGTWIILMSCRARSWSMVIETRARRRFFAVGASDADVGDVHVSSSFVSNRYCYSARLVKKYAGDREFLWILFCAWAVYFLHGMQYNKKKPNISSSFFEKAVETP